MAGDFVPEEQLDLQGWKKHFNSYTLRGRLNFVIATYASIFGAIIVYKLCKCGSKTSKIAVTEVPKVKVKDAQPNANSSSKDSSRPKAPITPPPTPPSEPPPCCTCPCAEPSVPSPTTT